MSIFFFFFSSRRRHTRWPRDWSSDVCSSDLLDDEPFSKTIGKDIVTVKEIEDYLLDSKEYFKDRNDIAHQRLLSWSEPARMVSIIKKDSKSKMKMDEFFAERGHVIQKVKKG